MKKSRAEVVRRDGTVVFFLADLEEAFFLSSSDMDLGAAPGALGG
jgi:hypothetical protein